jgi:hypothetical protein
MALEAILLPRQGVLGWRGVFPRELSSKVIKVTIHLLLIPRSRMAKVYLHGLVLN